MVDEAKSFINCRQEADVKNKQPQLNLRLDPEVKAWLDEKAKKTRLSRTWLVNTLIREEMERDRKKSAQ